MSVLVLAVLLPRRPCWAETTAAEHKQECVAAYDAGQKFKLKDQLVAAQQQFLVCAQAACPEVVSGDCARWLSEVDARLPTVVRARTRSGKELVDVRVSVDGQLLKERLDGKALAMDPGVRTFNWEAPGLEPQQQTVVVHEGAKSQMSRQLRHPKRGDTLF